MRLGGPLGINILSLAYYKMHKDKHMPPAPMNNNPINLLKFLVWRGNYDIFFTTRGL